MILHSHADWYLFGLGTGIALWIAYTAYKEVMDRHRK